MQKEFDMEKVDKKFENIPVDLVVYLKKSIEESKTGVTFDKYCAFILSEEPGNVISKKSKSIVAIPVEDDGFGKPITLKKKSVLSKKNCFEVLDADCEYPDTPELDIEIGEYGGIIAPFNGMKKDGRPRLSENEELEKMSGTVIFRHIDSIKEEVRFLSEISLKNALIKKENDELSK